MGRNLCLEFNHLKTFWYLLMIYWIYLQMLIYIHTYILLTESIANEPKAKNKIIEFDHSQIVILKQNFLNLDVL